MGPEDLGRQLRRARHHMGLSLRDVHSLTAIPLKCIAALEEGDLNQLPSPVYARGYIRSYAEAVRLDGDRLALELWRCMEETRVTAAGGSATAGRRPPSRSLASAAAPPIGAARQRQRRRTNGRSPSTLAPLRQPASPWVPKPGRLKRMGPTLERVGIAVLLIVLAVGIWDLQRSRPVHKPKAPAQAAAISQTHDGSPPPPSSVTSNAPPAATGTATLATTPVSDNGSLATYVTGAGRYSVQVQATDAPCWVQVRAGSGGAVLFQGTLQPGQTQPFDATGALWVRIGNLGHASVQVNGTPLVLPNKPSFPYNVLLQA